MASLLRLCEEAAPPSRSGPDVTWLTLLSVPGCCYRGHSYAVAFVSVTRADGLRPGGHLQSYPYEGRREGGHVQGRAGAVLDWCRSSTKRPRRMVAGTGGLALGMGCP